MPKLLGGKEGIKGTFYADGSSIVSVKILPENVEIKSRLCLHLLRGALSHILWLCARLIVAFQIEPMGVRSTTTVWATISELKKQVSPSTDGATAL
ncbi:hypothetical protein [Duncaniella dubosii]|uniref:hypothetical protein n=1 Tax=Duncaniella dubosii TaxID=2518971 RepID=UPI003F673542